MSRRALVWLCLSLAAAPAYAEPPPPSPAVTATTHVLTEEERSRLEAEAQRLEAEAQRLEAIERGTDRATEDGPSYVYQLFYTLVVLGAVVLLAYVLLGKLLPGLLGMTAAGRRGMIAAPSRGVVEVIDRLALDPRRSLLVVRVGQSFFLLSLSDQGTTLLARLEDPGPIAAASAPGRGGSFFDRFQGMLKRRPDQEGNP